MEKYVEHDRRQIAILGYYLGVVQAVILNLRLRDKTARIFCIDGHVCELQLTLQPFIDLQVRLRVRLLRCEGIDALT